MNLISIHFYKPLVLHTDSLNKNKSTYLFANDETSCLEVSPLRKMSLCEVFQKAQNYLQKDVHTDLKKFELEKQIEQLDFLLKESQQVITHYYKKSNTWCRRLLKLIHAYAPQILKNFLPYFFSNRIQQVEQNTHNAFQKYVACIEQLKNESQLKLRTIQILPPIHLLSDTLLQKIFQNGLSSRGRATALQVCKGWNLQLGKISIQENFEIDLYIQSLINEGLEDEKFEHIVEELKDISKNQKFDCLAFTLLDRLKFIQKDIYHIFHQNYLLLKDHAKIVKIAICQDGLTLEYAPNEIKEDPETVKLAVAQSGMALQFASFELQANLEIIKIAVTQDGHALYFAPYEAQNNSEIVKIAVAQDGGALDYASEELQGNIEIVKIAVNRDPQALEFATTELKNNTEIVRIAVAKNGQTLRYASAELKNNAEIVEIAIAQDGRALKYASTDLQNNVEIVKIAIAQNGRALKYASTELKGNADIVKIAVSRNRWVLKYASIELQNNPEILKMIKDFAY